MTIFGIADFESFAATKIGIVDNTNSEQSQELINGLKKISIISDVETKPKDEMISQLQKGNLDLVLELPKELVKTQVTPPSNSYNKPVISYIPQELTFYINEGRMQQASSAMIVIKEVFNQMTYKIYQMQELFTFKQEKVTDNKLTYVDYLIPGIIALSIMQMSLMQIIFTIVGYREKNIFKRLQTTPIKSIDFILSQVVTRLIISFMQVAVLVVIALLMFHVNINGSYWLMSLATILGSIVFIAMGIALSGIAKTQNTAAPLANIVMMPMMFLGDVFFPASTMPDWLGNLVQYLPLNYLAHAMREISINSATISSIATDLYGLIIWCVIMIIFASLAFRWKNND